MTPNLHIDTRKFALITITEATTTSTTTTTQAQSTTSTPGNIRPK